MRGPSRTGSFWLEGSLSLWLLLAFGFTSRDEGVCLSLSLSLSFLFHREAVGEDTGGTSGGHFRALGATKGLGFSEMLA